MVIARASGVLSERVGDETAVLDPASGRYTRLNGSGTFLWETLEEPTETVALVDRLVDRYGIDLAAARHDVARFIEMLRERGLIVAHGASAGLMIRSPSSRWTEAAASRARRPGSSRG
jgi:hypothetical protein